MVDGPTLKQARTKLGVTLRGFARLAGLSHGHISQVERGEPGRPATPHVVAAYETVLGQPVMEYLGAAQSADGDGLELSSRSRGEYVRGIGAVLDGARRDQAIEQGLDRHGIWPPLNTSADDLADLRSMADTLAGMDSAAAGWVARLILRWLVRGAAGAPADPELHRLMGELALLAADAAASEQQHSHARTLHLTALHAAISAGDLDLRARALIEVAWHLLRAGWRADCAEVLDRIGEPEQLGEDVRAGIKELRAEVDALERER